MAITNHAGFSARGGAALPTDLGQAISDQLRRLFARKARVATDDRASFAGPSFQQLSPSLAAETSRF